MSKLPTASSGTASVYAACLFFTACATGPDIPTVAELLSRNAGQDGGACMRMSEVRRYSVSDDELIFIDGSLGYYIVTINPGCQDLSTSPSIAFEGPLESCGGRMDRVSTRGHQCTIREIFKFENRDAAFTAYVNAQEQHQVLELEAKEAEAKEAEAKK